MGGGISGQGLILANASNSQKQAEAGPQRLALGAVQVRVTDAADAESSAMDLLRPFLLIAALSFLLGFTGYLAAVRPLPAQTAWSQTIAAPAADPANPSRAI
jgi:hypothetical protein